MPLICVACEAKAAMVPFKDETHQVAYQGATVDVDGLGGFRCPECGEIDYDADSAARYAAAGDQLVLAARKAIG